MFAALLAANRLSHMTKSIWCVVAEIGRVVY